MIIPYPGIPARFVVAVENRKIRRRHFLRHWSQPRDLLQEQQARWTARFVLHSVHRADDLIRPGCASLSISDSHG